MAQECGKLIERGAGPAYPCQVDQGHEFVGGHACQRTVLRLDLIEGVVEAPESHSRRVMPGEDGLLGEAPVLDGEPVELGPIGHAAREAPHLADHRTDRVSLNRETWIVAGHRAELFLIQNTHTGERDPGRVGRVRGGRGRCRFAPSRQRRRDLVEDRLERVVAECRGRCLYALPWILPGGV